MSAPRKPLPPKQTLTEDEVENYIIRQLRVQLKQLRDDLLECDRIKRRTTADIRQLQGHIRRLQSHSTRSPRKAKP